MTRRVLVLVALLAALVAVPLPGPDRADASCAAPSLDLGPAGAAPALALVRGRSASVEGRGFVDGCQDGMSCTRAWGCSRCVEDDPPPVPDDDVRLRLRQGERTWVLGTTDADAAGRVTWEVVVPPDVQVGRARLVADGAAWVRVDVVVG